MPEQKSHTNDSRAVMLPPHPWFEVTAMLRVQAADQSDAINRVTGCLRHGWKRAEAAGVHPVAEFDVVPSRSPGGWRQSIAPADLAASE